MEAPDLLEAPHHAEELLRQRGQRFRAAMLQFLPSKLHLQMTHEEVGRAIDTSLEEADVQAGVQPPAPRLRLAFRHDCLARGCPSESRCALCANSADRRCARTFADAYAAGASLKARCGAVIRVCVEEGSEEGPGGQRSRRCAGGLDGIDLQLMLLDARGYDQEFRRDATRGGGVRCGDGDVGHLLLLRGQDSRPLLSAAGGTNDGEGRLILGQLGGGGGGGGVGDGDGDYGAKLAEVQVSPWIHSALRDPRRPLRLLARAVWRAGGAAAPIEPAASEDFVILEKGKRGDGGGSSQGSALGALYLEDRIKAGLIANVGGATVKKLGDLRAAAAQAKVEIPGLDEVPNEIKTVGGFKSLVRRMERNFLFGEQLRSLLKLADDNKWGEVLKHVSQAMSKDGRVRAWCTDKRQLEVGLLFPCTLGAVDMSSPAALLLRQAVAGGALTVTVIARRQLSAEQQEVMRQLHVEAEQGWAQDMHSGWILTDCESTALPALMNGGIAHVAVPCGAFMPPAEFVVQAAMEQLAAGALVGAGQGGRQVPDMGAQGRQQWPTQQQRQEQLQQQQQQLTGHKRSMEQQDAQAPAGAPRSAAVPGPPPAAAPPAPGGGGGTPHGPLAAEGDGPGGHAPEWDSLLARLGSLDPLFSLSQSLPALAPGMLQGGGNSLVQIRSFDQPPPALRRRLGPSGYSAEMAAAAGCGGGAPPPAHAPGAGGGGGGGGRGAAFPPPAPCAGGGGAGAGGLEGSLPLLTSSELRGIDSLLHRVGSSGGGGPGRLGDSLTNLFGGSFRFGDSLVFSSTMALATAGNTDGGSGAGGGDEGAGAGAGSGPTAGAAAGAPDGGPDGAGDVARPALVSAVGELEPPVHLFEIEQFGLDAPGGLPATLDFLNMSLSSLQVEGGEAAAAAAAVGGASHTSGIKLEGGSKPAA